MDLLFADDAYLDHCQATVVATDGAQVRLNRTVFYPTGGGQPGDTGTLVLDDGTALPVVDTIKGDSHLDVIHVLAEEARTPAVGATVSARIHWERRHRHMRMHTGLHLLCSLVPGDVTGGQIGADRSRLDFNLTAEEKPDKEALTAALMAQVSADHAVETLWITEEEMAAQPELVRTMSVKPPSGGGRVRLLKIGDGVDLQPCGGTHVRRTGEIGGLQVTKIENKGRQNKRIVLSLL